MSDCFQCLAMLFSVKDIQYIKLCKRDKKDSSLIDYTTETDNTISMSYTKTPEQEEIVIVVPFIHSPNPPFQSLRFPNRRDWSDP